MVGINDNVILILALISRNKEFATPNLQAIVLSVEMLLQLGMVFTWYTSSTTSSCWKQFIC
jgi:hypothetical protein